jgi:ABC-type phosphate transport system permease subunit
MRIARTAAALGFRWSDRHRLAQTLKQVTMVRAYKRLQAVRLIAAGRAVKEVAPIVGVSAQTIYNWVNCYLQERTAQALCD